MSLTLDNIVEIVRNRLDLPANEVPRIKTLVDIAVQELIERTGMLLDERHYTFTDPDTTTVALDADGVADLGPLIISDGILLERLRFGEITHPDSPFPLKPISGTAEGRLGSNYTSLGLLRYWLVGVKLHTDSSDETPLTGSLSLAVPAAGGFSNLSVQLQNELIGVLVQQLQGRPDTQEAL